MSVTILRKRGLGVFIGIYKITSPSGRVYIGQSTSILHRWRMYRSRAKCLSQQPALFNSFQKHGVENHRFDILAWYSAGCDKDTLDLRECELIAEYKARGVQLLNIAEGGRGARHSDETKKKIGDANRGNKRPDLANYNRTVKPALMRGKCLSEDTRRKIGLAHKGKPSKCKGRVQGDEERAKRSRIISEWWAKRKGLAT